MDWREHISSDPKILGGKPAVRGTRLSVELLLGLFGEGWSREEVLDSYPRLTPDDLRAVFGYAAAVLRSQRAIPASALTNADED